MSAPGTWALTRRSASPEGPARAIRGTARPRGTALVLLVALALGPACGGGTTSATDLDAGGDAGAAGDGPVRPRLTQPSADAGAAAVEPHLTELLATHDRLVNRIVADPSVARDPDDPLVDQLLDLYHVEDGVAEDLRAMWVDRAEQGLRTLPFSEDHPATVSRLDGEVEVVAEAEVRFPYCAVRRYRVVDAGGDVVHQLPRQEQPGRGVAVRVDGTWHLRELAASTNRFGCRTGDPGAGESSGGDGTGGSGRGPAGDELPGG